VTESEKLPVPPGDEIADNEPEYQEDTKDAPLTTDIDPDEEPDEGDEGDRPDPQLEEVSDE
jgi:hypothetical protein